MGPDNLSVNPVDVFKERFLRHNNVIVFCFLLDLRNGIDKMQRICQIPRADAEYPDQEQRDNGGSDFPALFASLAEHHRHDEHRCDDQYGNPRIKILRRKRVELDQQRDKGRRQKRI